MPNHTFRRSLTTTAVLSALLLAAPSAYAACTTTIGSVMSLTGSLGALGQQIAKGAQLAVTEMNAAGDVNGCTLKLALLDDQTTPSVGVDAAKKLVDIQHVPALVGALSSGVSMAILTSVTGPGKIVQISPSSTSPALTELAAQGKTDGYWFRTTPSDALQGVAMAKVASDAKLKKVAVLYLNNPYGVGLAGKFDTFFTKMGGTVTTQVPYNASQTSYRSEVNKAMGGDPEALFLIGYPGDGTTVAREWIAAGGPKYFLLPDGLESQKFIDDVGAQNIDRVEGTAPGSATTPSLQTFKDAFKAANGDFPTQAYMTNAYDAVAVIALAMEAAKSNTAEAIRDHIRTVTGAEGTPIYAGTAEFKKAAGLLKEGKKIRYIGAAGPLTFDKNGDIAAPMVVWTVKDGKVTETGMVKVDEIESILKKLGS